jgi:hypothetical protein
MTLYDLEILILSVVATSMGVAAITISIWQYYGSNSQYAWSTYTNFEFRYDDIMDELPDQSHSYDTSLFDLPSIMDYQKLISLIRKYFDLCYAEYVVKENMRPKVNPKVLDIWEYGIKSNFQRTTFVDGWKRISHESKGGGECQT